MRDFDVNLELDVDRASVGDLAACAFDWLDGGARRLAGDVLRELERLPPPPPPRRPGAPLGPPGSLWGAVSVTRLDADHPPGRAEQPCSAAGLQWLRAQLADLPRWAELEYGYLDARGHRAGRALHLRVEHVPQSPGWLRLAAFEPEGALTDPAAGAARQRQWLGLLRAYADALDPGFGQVTYAYDGGATALEDSLPAREHPPQQRDPDFTLGQCRQVLRGYAWLTIVPQELVAPLGGARALAATAAFHEVAPLRSGGLWLLATADYRDFGDDAVARVFRVLARALRPGQPVAGRQFPGEPPHRIVLQDAATVTHP